MAQLIPFIPVLPLVGFLLLALGGKQLPKTIINAIACGSVLGAFIISLTVLIANQPFPSQGITVYLFDWIRAGSFVAEMSFLADPLSMVFLLVITGVGFLIHVYSIGYMHEDEGYHRFFSYMNLFIFFMTLLVLGDNFLLMFVGWEGVGFCSYLLIGFWFKNTAYNNAAVKAFVMNRIGDLGFLIGIILIFVTFGSLQYSEVFEAALLRVPGEQVIVAITLLLFIGATGKSAQIPLYTWLPDAMAGPTPVSALIHAATMVTAGIYMIARTNVLYTMAPVTLQVIAIIGIATALLAATIGLVQNDIKKVLAYSTVSQLGLMFLALGSGAYGTAVFHVVTHAFFKALLFLCAGAVIHALHGEQDLRRMGGLRKALPLTAITFFLAALAISGIPPFSGFFSKDEILLHAFQHDPVLWALGLLCSGLTTFYVFRVFYLTFSGKFRGDQETMHHLHKPSSVITIPLAILAVLSVVGGLIGLPEVFGGGHALQSFLSPVFAHNNMHLEATHVSHATELTLMTIAVVVSVIALVWAMYQYRFRQSVPAPEGLQLNPLHRMAYFKYYVDELYNALVVKPLYALSQVVYRIGELKVIDGIVEWTGKAVLAGGQTLRWIQTGRTVVYMLVMVVAIIILLISTNF